MKTSQSIEDRTIGAGPGTESFVGPFKDGDAKESDSQENCDCQADGKAIFIVFPDCSSRPPYRSAAGKQYNGVDDWPGPCPDEHPPEARQGILPAGNNMSRTASRTEKPLKSGRISFPVSSEKVRPFFRDCRYFHDWNLLTLFCFQFLFLVSHWHEPNRTTPCM